MTPDSNTALMIIDLQKAIDDPFWAAAGLRNNIGAESIAKRLLSHWRAVGRPVVHVRHDSVELNSTYHPGSPGHGFKAGFEPESGELVIGKSTGSAFTGTSLEMRLRERNIGQFFVAGVITNNSVETTVRHGATLGFAIAVVEDACFTFARRDWNGVLRTAHEVHAMSLANLSGEYCEVVRSTQISGEHSIDVH